MAYFEYSRIHADNDVIKPTWDELTHEERVAWEAAARCFLGFDGRPKNQEELEQPPAPKEKEWILREWMPQPT